MPETLAKPPLVVERCADCGLFIVTCNGLRADHLTPDEAAWVAACYMHGDARLPFLRSATEEWLWNARFAPAFPEARNLTCQNGRKMLAERNAVPA